ncbi:class I SAM-dependent methyltransferase [Muricauda sp. 40Bstr401]|uniref:Class I SAM-dependent methyltransferase n=2 Tax=Flagellimonas sediminis TaxID=2696468 RepID=A0A6I5KRN7_9FLAO|nr:class I SAM-dependent methyltransferase [Allomuricauda sediminis]
MNELILNTGVQHFIIENMDADIMSVLLKSQQFEGVSQRELAEQLESRKKCRGKLPAWFQTKGIYYPNKLNIEQTSSQATAEYKSRLVSGKNLLDLTGGFGVDSYFFSKKIEQITHCEINTDLSEIARRNFNVLGRNNIDCFPEDGLTFLQKTEATFDWIYVDPSRRNDAIGKVFLLKDCLPDLTEHLDDILQKTQNVLIKTSPLLDIKQGISELQFVKEVHILAIHNEVKELLFVIEKGYVGAIDIKTVNLYQGQEDHFNFNLTEEENAPLELGEPSTYLYEPNAAILKSGAFKAIGSSYQLKKLHPHSHLYTSSELVEFPGRRFAIQTVLPYSKNTLKSLRLTKANITTRNFPLSVADLRKKHKIADGGDHYLFFTKNMEGELIVLVCEKA